MATASPSLPARSRTQTAPTGHSSSSFSAAPATVGAARRRPPRRGLGGRAGRTPPVLRALPEGPRPCLRAAQAAGVGRRAAPIRRPPDLAALPPAGPDAGYE